MLIQKVSIKKHRMVMRPLGSFAIFSAPEVADSGAGEALPQTLSESLKIFRK